jgi:hypothetical protein
MHLNINKQQVYKSAIILSDWQIGLLSSSHFKIIISKTSTDRILKIPKLYETSITIKESMSRKPDSLITLLEV